MSLFQDAAFCRIPRAQHGADEQPKGRGQCALSQQRSKTRTTRSASCEHLAPSSDQSNKSMLKEDERRRAWAPGEIL